MNFQPTSVPYVADLLDVHDRDLLWAREFGTDTTDAIGDAFSRNGFLSPSVTTINARRAALQVRRGSGAVLDTTTPQGNTFLLPPADPAASPLQVDVRILFAKIRFAEAQNNGPQSDGTVSLVLGPASMVGNCGAVPFKEYALQVPPLGAAQALASLRSYDWDNAGGYPAGPSATCEIFGSTAYFRISLVTFEGGSLIFPSFSQDGLTWQFWPGEPLIDYTIARAGLAIRGFVSGQLDWMRVYSYAPIAVEVPPPMPEPQPPDIGGRIFTP